MTTNLKLKFENYQLKESNLILQKKCKDEKERNEKLICEFARLKKEYEKERKIAEEMNRNIGIVMQTMKTVFNDRHM